MSGMSENPKFCLYCGGGLSERVYGEGHWSAVCHCVKCEAKCDITYGDQMGGSAYCYPKWTPPKNGLSLKKEVYDKYAPTKEEISKWVQEFEKEAWEYNPKRINPESDLIVFDSKMVQAMWRGYLAGRIAGLK